MCCPELKLMELAICLVSEAEPLPRFTEAQAEEGGAAGHGQVCSGSKELSRVTVVGHWEAVLGKMARVYARKNYSSSSSPSGAHGVWVCPLDPYTDVALAQVDEKKIWCRPAADLHLTKRKEQD